ncbi:Gas vesicle protein [Synechococcus sp. 63AY4M2]|nr:Gas vesicle protein [Synechococcus sp. 63AY4M2]PIK88389.1 Gas vesicle protein [Synechococcus sp. 65AY6A5]PIK92820.1 Gas vesicle protein [Synechococcus sp. 65AY6Li]PIK94179.1 Gas vesicle protein [Synechococcus sp. 60AY4M2]PIK98762.1 Gas vesicle protein [Synechococcus sp. 63AY4M1]PIL00504.1 Gas vesicle protein [Synechococcus sp. 65AY640]
MGATCIPPQPWQGMAENRTGAFVGGLLLGTAVGTVIGLLLAPRSGRETRRLLKKSAEALPEVAEDVTTSLQYQSEKLLDSAQKSLDEALLRLQQAVAVGREAMLQKRQELMQAQNLRPLAREEADSEAQGREEAAR